MALAITAAPSDELLSVEEAKRHLRLYSSDLDGEVASLVRAARDYCERFTQRTLRKTTTRTMTLCEWWSDEQKLPWPPLISVTGITYYDVDNVSQTLATSNYTVVTTTDGAAKIVWVWDATIPSIYSRPDAITITFTTGYATTDPAVSQTALLPPVALQAMKTKCTELFGDGGENEIKAAKECTDRLLAMVDWTGYA